MRELVEDLKRFHRETGDVVTVVFDGRRREELVGAGGDDVTVAFARRSGRDAADDRIAELLDDDPDPGSVTVATSDRDLAGRARERGAVVVGGGDFRSRLGSRP